MVNTALKDSAPYQPKGIQFYDAASKRYMILVDEPGKSWDGWLAYQHPDGRWVSLRKATPEDVAALSHLAGQYIPIPAVPASALSPAKTLNPSASRESTKQAMALWSKLDSERVVVKNDKSRDIFISIVAPELDKIFEECMENLRCGSLLSKAVQAVKDASNE